MGSRIRGSPTHVFDCFCEVAIPKTAEEEPFVLQKYPESYNDAEILKTVPQFSYPCVFVNQNVLHFSFVLTSIDSKWTFGFCRHAPAPANTCLVLLSSLPWHDTFYKVLNEIASLTNKQDPLMLSKFLEALHATPVPGPEQLLLQVTYYVSAREYQFKAPCPDHHKIPTIPEDRNLTEYFNAIDGTNMIIIFASMLNERRIIITSKRLSRLAACIQAANSLIFPMFWQHIFIPVLPTHLLDYLSAPMPFLIGVPSVTMLRVKRQELGDIVILDADENKVETPFDDIHMLPTEIISFLKRSLKPPNNNILGDSLSRIFLKALVMLIGGYRDALSFPSGQKITFNQEAFISSRPPPMQPFLEKMLQLQIFQQFVEGRLQMLHEGEGFNDEFEFELNTYEDRNTHKLKTQYTEWVGGIKKEGSAILKSVNPAMKSAYRQVKSKGKQVRDHGKRAYKDIRNKLQDKSPTGESGGSSRPRSAPSSPNGSPTENRKNFAFGAGVKSKNGGGSGFKKSSSGVIATRTDKSVDYVRDRSSRQGDSTNKLFNGNLQTSSLTVSDFGASALSCDELVSTASLFDDSLKAEPINMDLMGDISDVLQLRRCSLTAPELQYLGHASSSPAIATLTAPPLPPPRIPNGTSSKRGSRTADNLIQLESPPEDLTTIFDPLRTNSTSLATRSSSQLEIGGGLSGGHSSLIIPGLVNPTTTANGTGRNVAYNLNRSSMGSSATALSSSNPFAGDQFFSSSTSSLASTSNQLNAVFYEGLSNGSNSQSLNSSGALLSQASPSSLAFSNGTTATLATNTGNISKVISSWYTSSPFDSKPPLPASNGTTRATSSTPRPAWQQFDA